MTKTSYERKSIKGFPGYAVDTNGNVYSRIKQTPINLRGNIGASGTRSYFSKTWKKIKIQKSHNGYNQICLRKDKKSYSARVARLILSTFISKCPIGMVACHNNGVRTDDRLENLRWDTYSNNEKDKDKHGTKACGERQGSSKLKEFEVRDIKKSYPGLKQKQLALKYNVSEFCVWSIINKKTWKHVV